jgi:uncharacterized membrane-anchored protein YjiN (DUF445 family)
MSWYLVWLVPPLVGAAIGYITNAIAIKMLFRPLGEIKFFGMRLPFTPGILPRRRHRLAESIGAMVERELITPELISRRLNQEDVRENVKTAVAAYTEKLLAFPLSRLLPGNNRKLNPADAGAMATLFRGFIASPVFEAIAERAIDHFFLSRSVWELLGDTSAAELRKNLEKIILSKLRSEREQVSSYLGPVLEQAFPRIASLIIEFFERKEIREELEVQGSIFLSSAILKLNVFQRFFISAGQYDRTLHERMPEIIDDLIMQLDALLRDEAIRNRIILLFQNMVQDILSEKNTEEGLPRFITDLLITRLDKPLGEIIRGLSVQTGTVHEPPGGKILFLIRKILAGDEQHEQGKSPLPLFLEELLKTEGDYRISELFLIDGEKKALLDSLLRDKLLVLAEEQISAALRTINIKAMVIEQIDSLEMIKVERIVLDVIGRELKWINIFGAILGALIGLFQAAFAWLSQAF